MVPSPRQPAIKKAVRPENRKQAVDHSKHDHYRKDMLENEDARLSTAARSMGLERIIMRMMRIDDKISNQ